LFDVFLEYYEQPHGQRKPQYLSHDKHTRNKDEGAVLAACDEISGLTDNQAIYYFEALNSPSSFKGWMGWFGNFAPSN
jgi:dGTP triphosphohydrolase